jgi:hypothetical protein
MPIVYTGGAIDAGGFPLGRVGRQSAGPEILFNLVPIAAGPWVDACSLLTESP